MFSVCGLSIYFLSDAFFWRAKVLNFDKVQFISIFFYSLCFWCYMQALYLIQDHKDFLPCFLVLIVLCLIVLGFIFRSMIHFEFIFIEGVRVRLRFIFLHMEVQLFKHYILKRLSFLDWIAFVKNQLNIFVWFYFWIFYTVSLILIASP